MTDQRTFDEFNDYVTRRLKEQPDWRYGQTLFNCLADWRPDLSEQIRTTELDPFHRDEISGDCWQWIRDSWSGSEAARALEAAYEALAASENDEDRAFHAAMRARRGRPSAAIRAAVEAARAADGETPDELFLERYRNHERRNLTLLAKMEVGGELDHKLLREMESDGHRAGELIATYYDNLTAEDLELEFEGSKPVRLLTPPGGIRVSYGVTFTREELKAIRQAIGDGKSFSRFVHDTAVAYAAQLQPPEV